MKTKTINVYDFDELSDEAKRAAIEACRPIDNVWFGENMDALKAFSDLFEVDFKNGLVYMYNSIPNELSPQRLATYIWNNYRDKIYKPKQFWICNGRHNTVGEGAKHFNSNVFLVEDGCPLTGYYMDNEILGPVFDFMRNPKGDFNDLMHDCYDAWETAYDKDWEFQNSDEQIIENIKANEYTFTENGKLELI